MKYLGRQLALVIILLSLPVFATRAGEPRVDYFGRFDLSDAAGPKFSWPGSSLRARFRGSQLKMTLKNLSDEHDQFYTAVLDKLPPRILELPAGKTVSFDLGSHLSARDHDVLIVRDNEALAGRAQFLGFDFGRTGRLLAPHTFANSLRLEVIGDSITAGYGDMATNCTFSFETQSAFITYSFLATQRMHAQPPTLIATSGRGIYRNYQGETNDPVNPAMPVLYQRLNQDDAFRPWAFSKNAKANPNVVLINLGTNDIGSNTASAKDPLSSAFKNFAMTIWQHYPESAIILATSPMLSGPGLERQKAAIREALTQLRLAGHKRVHYFEFVQSKAPYGCDNHPSAATHAAMARQLIAFFHTLGF